MEPSNFSIKINETAIKKLQSVLKEKPAGSFLRINVASGGCSGFSVSFIIDSILQEDDITIKDQNVSVVINKMIAEFVEEAELHFRSDLLNSYFFLDVKTATAKCSCGSSFSK